MFIRSEADRMKRAEKITFRLITDFEKKGP